MREIDETTGLAALPEGFHWKVDRYSFKYKGEYTYRIKVMKDTVKQVWRLTWYLKPYQKQSITSTEIFEAPVWDRSYGTVEYASRLTDSILRAASFEALEGYYEEVAKQKRLSALEDHSGQYLGDYPPKSIN